MDPKTLSNKKKGDQSQPSDIAEPITSYATASDYFSDFKLNSINNFELSNKYKQDIL